MANDVRVNTLIITIESQLNRIGILHSNAFDAQSNDDSSVYELNFVEI